MKYFFECVYDICCGSGAGRRLAACVAAVLVSFSGLRAQVPITSLSDITDPDGSYVVSADIDASGYVTIASFGGKGERRCLRRRK